MYLIFLFVLLILCIPSQKMSSISSRFYKRCKKSKSEDVGLLEHFLWDLGNGELKALPEAEFKFYRPLILKLVDFYRSSGELSRDILTSLQASLENDYKFDLKLKGLSFQSFAQFSVTALFTWFFVISGLLMLELEPKPMVLLFMLLVQVGGACAFIVGKKWGERRYFGATDQLFQKLILFLCFYETSLSMREILEESKILVFEKEKRLPLDHLRLYERVKKLIYHWKESGNSVRRELITYEERFHFLQVRQYEKLLKYTKGLHFFILCFFFLPCYFLFILSLFDAFLIE